jgi:iron(III) transport system permease protein
VSGWRVAVLLLLLALIVLPLLAAVDDGLAYPEGWHVWDEAPRLWGLARNTLRLVGGTLALALPAGIVGAVLLYRTDLPGRELFRFAALLTLFVPLPLFASGWQAALGSGGWLPATFWSPPAPSDPDVSPTGLVWKAWGSGFNAALWIHAVAALPWVVLLVGQGLRWVERDLEEDALTCAGPWRVLASVTLRRSLAAVGGAALWVALQTATEITVTDMFQVRTFGEEVYTQLTRPDTAATGQAEAGPLTRRLTRLMEPDRAEGGAGIERAVARAVYAALPSVLVTAALVLAAAGWWGRRLPPLETLATEPHLYRLGQARWPCCVALALFVVVVAGVPVGSLVWKLGLAGSPRHWSGAAAMEHLGHVLRTRGRLVAESLALAGLAGAVTAVLALVTCWLAVGTRWFQAAILLLLAVMWALPGPIVGLGLKGAINWLLLFDAGNVLGRLLYYGPSPAPALWAYLLRFFACAVAVLWPVVRLLPRDLREAARVDGAGPAQELRHVVGPLTFPALLRAGLVVAVLALGELSAGKLVETPGSQTFAHEVFTQMHYGVTNDLAAFCLILLGAVAAGALLVAAAGWVVRRQSD